MSMTNILAITAPFENENDKNTFLEKLNAIG